MFTFLSSLNSLCYFPYFKFLNLNFLFFNQLQVKQTFYILHKYDHVADLKRLLDGVVQHSFYHFAPKVEYVCACACLTWLIIINRIKTN